MSSLTSVSTARSEVSPHVPADIVVPLHSRDDTNQNRNISIEFTMRFDDVLDSQKLVDSLWKLLEKPGWNKVGARLRLNTTNGRLEYHIPSRYTKERPPVNFTQKTYDMRFEEHPIGRKFPVVDEHNDNVQSFDVLDSLRGITQTENSTTVLDDWIHTDKAQLGLHVVSFKDTTLVTLTWLHTLLDAMGRQALLKAWQAVLEGRDDDVPEFWGFDFDPLAQLGAPLGEDKTTAEDKNTPDVKVQEKQQGSPSPASEIKKSTIRPDALPFIGNAATGIVSPFSLKQFLDMPLGHIAARIRKDLVEQGNREAVEASQRASRIEQQTNMAPPDAQMAPAVFVVSNWAKAKLFEISFSAAVVPRTDNQGGPVGKPTTGKPTYIHVYGTDKRASGSGVGPGGIGNCVGKDARGGYWLGGICSGGWAERFEKAVLSDA
ncbi:lysr family regulatory protein [Alternaria alternata]|nr:lysr family regulatory protein [Alternaria alternata]